MEAVCGTRTLLQYGVSQAAQQARIILIGSAVSGEGKTSLSLLLARSLAQAGNRTLLIDGDLRRPALHASLCVPSSPGLCEYLTGRADLAEICYPSDSPDLTVVPAGVWSDAASQALAGPSRWPDLVRRVTVEYDYVLIDSSPFLPVADALLMARAVDGVLLTVMSRSERGERGQGSTSSTGPDRGPGPRGGGQRRTVAALLPRPRGGGCDLNPGDRACRGSVIVPRVVRRIDVLRQARMSSPER